MVRSSLSWRLLLLFLSLFLFVYYAVLSASLGSFFNALRNSTTRVKEEKKKIVGSSPGTSTDTNTNTSADPTSTNTSTTTTAPAASTTNPAITRDGKQTQKILILPGPHKTGSTSVQTGLVTLINKERDIFHDWAWPVPKAQKLTRLGIRIGAKSKMFSFLQRLYGGLRGNKSEPPKVTLKVLELFRQAIQHDWDQGKNLVIAAEYFDWLAAEEDQIRNNNMKDFINNKTVSSGEDLRDVLLNFLPAPRPGIEREIVVVVHYRRPRVDHLLSIWHQTGQKGGKAPFSEWLLSGGKAKALNSMRLLQVFHRSAEVPVRLFLLDTQGAKDSNTDLTHSIVCVAMGVPCEEYSQSCIQMGHDGQSMACLLQWSSPSRTKEVIQVREMFRVMFLKRLMKSCFNTIVNTNRKCKKRTSN